MIEQTYRINEHTGEVVKSNIRHIAAAFDDDKGYLFWARKSFAKSFLDVPFPKSLTPAEIGRLTLLAKCIWSNTNMLGYRGNGGVKPYNIDIMAGKIGLKSRQTHSFITKMIKLGMMAKVEVKAEDRIETQYYINPIYFFSSNRIPLNLYLIFRKQLDEVLPDWVKDRFNEASK